VAAPGLQRPIRASAARDLDKGVDYTQRPCL